MATWARNINTDLGCSRTMSLDMVLSSSPGCHHGPRWPCRPSRLVWPLCQHPQISAWPHHSPQWWQEPQTSSAQGCSKALDQDMTCGHSSGLGVSLDLGDQLVIYNNPFFTTLTSPDLPLSPLHKPFHVSFTSLPCELPTQWYLAAQCQGSWLGNRWCLVKYCLSQS